METESRRRRGRATWIVRGDRIAATPRLPRGYSDANGPRRTRRAHRYLADAFGSSTLAEAASKGDAFIAWLETQDASSLKEALADRKDYRDKAEADADQAKLDPEAAAKLAEDKRRAVSVEAMLNDIMVLKDAKDAEAEK